MDKRFDVLIIGVGDSAAARDTMEQHLADSRRDARLEGGCLITL